MKACIYRGLGGRIAAHISKAPSLRLLVNTFSSVLYWVLQKYFTTVQNSTLRSIRLQVHEAASVLRIKGGIKLFASCVYVNFFAKQTTS
jgi:hypothetical protein